MLLSIAMIVKDEEWILNRSLEALNQLKDKVEYEIVVVDTGSKDDTINIAKKYTKDIYRKEWTNNFSEMRNYSISKCNGDWILILDADEILESSDELINFLKDKCSKNYNSATLKRKEIITNKIEEATISYSVRLFRNNKEFYYTGRIHEQPNVLPPTKLTNISLLHYGYSRESFKLMNYKYERNLKLLLEDLRENDKNPYTYFQLAQTYGMAKMNDKAFENIIKAYKLIKNDKNQEKYLYIYQLLIQAIFINKDYKKTIELCKKAISYNINNLDFYYFISKSYNYLNEYEKAKPYYDKYFELHKKIEEGYIDKNISLSNNSFSLKKDMLKDRIGFAFKSKDYKFILDNYKSYQENDIEYVLIYTFIINEKYSNVFKYYRNKEIKDENIDTIILACENVNKKILNDDISNIYSNLLGLSEKLDNYINYIYKHKELKNIDFKGCYLYKLKIFSKKVIENKKYMDSIKGLSKNDIYNYLFNLINDYRGIEILYDYSNDNFLNSNINDLSFLIIVEDILIKNENIDKKDYSSLVYRTLINKINYLKNIYNKEVLNKYYKNICNKNESFFIEILELLRIYSIDKYKYVRTLKTLLNEYPEYKVLINYLKENIIINSIDYKIILNEKEKLMRNIEILIKNNRIQEVDEIMEEIKDVFKYDDEINNLLGIINYLKRDYENSLIYFGLSNILNENNFNSIYNLSLILDEKGRIYDSKFYYKKALEVSDNEVVRRGLFE